VRVTLTFLTPALPDDLDVLAWPVTYVTWDVASADGKAHNVQVTFGADAGIAVNDPEQVVVQTTPTVNGLAVSRVGTQEQPVLERKRDYEPVAIRPEARKALREGANVLAVHCKQTRGGQYVDVGLCRVTESP